MEIQCLVILLTSAIITVAIPIPNLRPITSKQLEDKDDIAAMKFLERYGHVGGNRGTEEEDYYVALTRYQRYHGLPQTGRLDNATRSKMAEPRCGLPDVGLFPGSPYSEDALRFLTIKNYSLNPSLLWEKRSLSYMVHSGIHSLSEKTMYYVAALALQFWCIPSQLQFSPVHTVNESDIEVSFGTGLHGDCPLFVEFDGPGGILAHALWPFVYQLGRGDVHVDFDEHWDVDYSWSTRNIIQVLTHEFGHSMGIMHTDDKEATMYPHYKYDTLTRLSEDDMKAIQILYGPPNNMIDLGRRCTLELARTQLNYIDAAVEGHLGEIYLFKGNIVYDLYEEPEYDYLAFEMHGTIQDHFPGAPDEVHAAASYGGYVYLIKDFTVYRYTRTQGHYELNTTTTMMAEFQYSHSLPKPKAVAKRVDGNNKEELEFINGNYRKVYPPNTQQPSFFSMRLPNMGSTNANDIRASFSGKVFDNDGKLQSTRYTIYSTYYTRQDVESPMLKTRPLEWAIPD